MACGGCCMYIEGSIPSKVGEHTCGSSAVSSFLCSKIDRRGRCVHTDQQASPADGKRDIRCRSDRDLSKLYGLQ